MMTIRHGNAKYSWESWTDGNTHIAKRGIDFHCQVGSFVALLHNKLKAPTHKHVYSVSTSVDGDTVTFQYELKENRNED